MRRTREWYTSLTQDELVDFTDLVLRAHYPNTGCCEMCGASIPKRREFSLCDAHAKRLQNIIAKADAAMKEIHANRTA